MQAMRTPKRYTIGTCTFAVAMLERIDWPLPDGPEKDYAETDVASFQEIYESLRRIMVTVIIKFSHSCSVSVFGT